MPHTHEGGLRHDHDGGDVSHSHDDVDTTTTTPRGYGPGPVPAAPVTGDRPGYVEREREYPYSVRGGFSFGAILTGVVVALGAMLLLTALIGGIVAAAGVDGGTTGDEVVQLGWGAAIGLIVATFLAYLWGGYTSGRMARGVGWLNGLMVPIAAIIIAVLIGLLVRWMGADTGVDVPYGANRVPVGFDVDQFRNIGLVAGIGSLIAMFLGAIFGGTLGARWHDKLEARHGVDEETHLRAA
jgi:hypothetical protein